MASRAEPTWSRSPPSSTKNAASSGYYFYIDYLWPLVPQDVPDAPQVYSDVSLAIDFDTDHGYKKPPAWHLWQLQKLGFKGHADVYMGVFWNNKRRRVGATFPYATIAFTGTPAPGDVVSVSIGGTTIAHAIGYGESLQHVVSQIRAAINGMFSGVWADDNYGTSTTLRIQSKAPSWIFTGLAVARIRTLHSATTWAPPVRKALGDDRRHLASDDRRRAPVDQGPCRPVSGGGHHGVVRVLDGVLPAARRDAREVSVLHRRRGCARRGRRSRRSFTPDALRHARPDLPAADVQGVRRPDRGGRRAGDPSVW